MQYQLQNFLPMVERAIQEIQLPESPESLYGPIQYFMNLPGKRIRPIFVLQALELFRQAEFDDAKAALCTELFHNFSLVHDDIMDKADLRRGFQTVHIKWNEPTAILAGDALLVKAYDALLFSKTSDFKELLISFNKMALAVCEGQQLDMDFSNMESVTLPAYLDMIDKKTAALIAFSFELGGFLGNASAEDRKILFEFGFAMGRCFQLRDDHLDLFGNEKVIGKKRGGDIGNSKLTFPVLSSMEHEDSSSFFSLWTNKELEPELRISSILTWMENSGIPALSEHYLQVEMDRGIQLLDQLSSKNPESSTRIIELCKALAFREK